MKQNNEEIKIGISKVKSVFLLLFAFVIFFGASWFWFKAIHLSGFSRTFLIICTSLLILVSGSGIISGLSRLFDSSPGLILNEKGIFINIGPASGHFVNWTDIVDLKLNSAVNGPFFISIYVNNPQDYLAKTYGFKKFNMKMNNKSHGTPLSFTTSWLKCNFQELFVEIRDRIEKNNG